MKRLVIGSDRSGRHRGEIKGKGMDGEGTERIRYGGTGRGRGKTYLSLCNPPDSSQRQLERGIERDKHKERGEGDKSRERRKDRREKEREKEGAPWQITCQPL